VSITSVWFDVWLSRLINDGWWLIFCLGNCLTWKVPVYLLTAIQRNPPIGNAFSQIANNLLSRICDMNCGSIPDLPWTLWLIAVSPKYMDRNWNWSIPSNIICLFQLQKQKYMTDKNNQPCKYFLDCTAHIPLTKSINRFYWIFVSSLVFKI